MLPSLRHSTRAARAATHQRWIERTSAGSTRLLLNPPRWIDGSRRAFCQSEHRREYPVATETLTDLAQPIPAGAAPQRVEWRKLPVVCPGCGAHSQTVESEAAGYYGNKRRKRNAAQVREKEDEEVFQQALKSGALNSQTGAVIEETKPTNDDTVPICDRCHNLHHNGVGSSIIHPSMHSIQQIIEESPHKQNHIYHVIDAADFPMSLIPNLQYALDLPRTTQTPPTLQLESPLVTRQVTLLNIHFRLLPIRPLQIATLHSEPPATARANCPSASLDLSASP